MCATRPAQSTQNSKFADLCNIPEKYGSEVDFLPENKHKSFLQVIVSLWVYVARHAQTTQNNKFTISL